MPRSPWSLAVPALLAALGTGALAGDAPGKEAPREPAPPAQEEPYHGPEIEWARSYAEAKQEAAERNLPIFIHSHGST